MFTVDLKFKPYSEDYFSSCVDLIISTWDFHSDFFELPNKRIVYEYYLKTCLNWNHHLDLITDKNNQVKGILFGSKEEITYPEELKFSRIDRQINKWKNKKIKQGEFGEKEAAKHALTRFIMNDCIGEEDAYLFDGEVNLFIVSQELRNKGLGRQLMNRYLDFCRINRVEKIFLWTDVNCNYKFYSNFGFSVHKRFKTYIGYKVKSKFDDGIIFHLNMCG